MNHLTQFFLVCFGLASLGESALAVDRPTEKTPCLQSVLRGDPTDVCCKVEDSVFWDTKVCCSAEAVRGTGSAERSVRGTEIEAGPCKVAFEKICCQTPNGYTFDYRKYCQAYGGKQVEEKSRCEEDETRICCLGKSGNYFMDQRKNCRNLGGRESFEMSKCGLKEVPMVEIKPTKATT